MNSQDFLPVIPPNHPGTLGKHRPKAIEDAGNSNGGLHQQQHPLPSKPLTRAVQQMAAAAAATSSSNSIPIQIQQQTVPVNVLPPPGGGGSAGAAGLPNDISRLSHPELVQRVRKLETDLLKLASDHNHMIREANLRIQAQATEISTLNGAIKRLEEDNAELRDLCCFLDDDRQKGRKLAREWQRFGRYTASVMRQEVAAYQAKLRDLDNRQQQLVSDNTELKELCLYLDEERNQNSCSQCGAAFRRDDGDGSSSGTNAAEEFGPPPNISMDSNISTGSSASGQNSNSPPLTSEEIARGLLNGKILEYVKRLEGRIVELEKQDSIPCPESVLNALSVLQVCQGLDDHDIGDEEKAIVRQMCNVVWKKLEDNPKLQ